MDNVLARLKFFYKAQAIKDPVALATYVTRRYGSMDKFAMARGMAGKKRAKEWNPVKNIAGSKTGKSANAPKGGPRQRELPGMQPGRGQGGKKTRMPTKSVELDKAQAIEDSRKLASELSRRSKGATGALWHGGTAPAKAWKTYEGGIRGKARAKEWNPVVGPAGSKYDASGLRDRPKKKQARLGGKFASRGKARYKGGTGKEKPSYQPAMKIGGKRIGDKKEKSIDITKTFDVLVKAHKFGGKPLGWEDLPRDPIAFATNVLNHKGYWYSNIKAGTKGAKMRNTLSQGIRALVNKIPEASAKEKKQGEIKDTKYKAEAKKLSEEMEDSWKKGERPDVKVEKGMFPPALASLAAFGAGWAMSDTFTEAPRGQMTPSQQRDWERLIRSAMRRKKDLHKDAIDGLRSYYKDSSDTYVKRMPIDNSLALSKEHAPIPPRQGLVWDEQKHHWTRQEHVGHTVAEVQGKKRVRGTGTGVHERTRAGGGAGGKGVGMSVEAGRRFRSSADVGVIKPQDAKHPSTSHQKITRKKLLQHLRGRAGTVRTVH